MFSPQARTIKVRESLHEECKKKIANYRSHKPKGAIAQGLVGLLLEPCRGELDHEPDFNGKTPDYGWTVAPEIPSSFRFIVEVVYCGGGTSRAIEQVREKVHKYRPLGEHQYYVVALVYEEGTDIKEVASHCMSGIAINWAIDVNTGESTIKEQLIPRKFTDGNASLLWAIPFPEDSTGGTATWEMQVIEILSSNAKSLPSGIFSRNLLTSPCMPSDEYERDQDAT